MGEDEGMGAPRPFRLPSIAVAIPLILASLFASTPGRADEPLRASLDFQILDGPYQNSIQLNGSAPDTRAAVDRDPSSPYYGTIYAVSDISSWYCEYLTNSSPQCYSTGTLTLHRSVDGGRTFDGPRLIDLCSESNEDYCRRGRDPGDIAVGNDGVVYIVTVDTVLRSVDRGASWQTVALFDEFAVSASITTDPATGVVFVAGVNSSNAVLLTKSLDAGDTWSSPTAVSNLTTGALAQVAALRDSVVVAVTSDSGPLASVVVTASRDGGLTWPAATEVSSLTLCPSSAPSVSASPEGIFAVSWYAPLSGAGCSYGSTATFVSISRDGGLSFSPPVEVHRYEQGHGIGVGDALTFDDRSRLFVVWNQLDPENGSAAFSVFVAYAALGGDFSTASFNIVPAGEGANGTFGQHLATGLNGRVYLTSLGGDEEIYGTFFRSVSGEAFGNVIPERQTVPGTIVDVELVDHGSGAVRARATWTGSPIVLADVPPCDPEVWVRFGNLSALAGVMPVQTWNTTAFTIHLEGGPAGPGPPPFPWTVAAAVGGIVLFATAALLALQHTRLAREEILQRQVRLLIYNAVCAHPGISFTKVRDAIGLQNGVAAYHLNVLEKQGLLHSEKGRRHRWYYPNGDVSLWRDWPLSPLQKALIEKVGQAPGIGIRELSRSLNRRHGSIAYNVKGLSREGLLRTQRMGRKVQCFPTDQSVTP